MADTGWIRWTNTTDIFGDFTNDTNIISPNTGETFSNGATTDTITLLSLSSLSIPTGARITGIAYKFRAKKTSDTPNLKTQLSLTSGFTKASDINTETLTDSYVDYEVGGDGNILGFKQTLISDTDDPAAGGFGIESLILKFTTEGTGIVYIEGTSESPAVKIFYEPVPDGTSVSDWVRFTTLDSSDGWYDSSDTNLASPNEGNATWLNPLTNPYFIGSGFDFGVPSNATITGIEYRTVIQANLFGLSTNQVWNGKLSTDSFLEGDITDEFFTIASTDYDTLLTVYQTGSFEDTFGLTLTGNNVNDLKLGFLLSQTGGGVAVAGSILGEQGDGTTVYFPTPSIRVFYTTPEPTPSPSLEPKFAVRSSGFYVRESSF